MAAAAGGLVGVGAAGAGRVEAAPIEGTTIELDARRDGWEGVAPDAIAGTNNPTLDLVAGTTYALTWTNRDGRSHNFALRAEDGTVLQSSAFVDEQGATQTVEFTATAEMAEYVCEAHPGSMRGDVTTGDGGGDGGGGGEPAGSYEPAFPVGPTVALDPVAEGFVSPVDFAVAEEDRDRRFVVDQVGVIYVHERDGLREEPFIDVSDRLPELGLDRLGGFDERGLLGVAFHPEFADNRKFYLRYSAPLREGMPADYDHTFVLSEFRAAEDFERGDPASERILLEIPEPQFNHNSGAIAFGKDGYLYVTCGDGGDADDTGLGHVEDWYDGNEGGNGQDVTENLLGSVLRLDVDARTDGKPYGIPEENPLVGKEGLDEQYAWGFRNPWRLSFDGDDLYVADVGQNLFEEVNLVEKGGNYGWNVKEGSHCFSTADPSSPPSSCPRATPDGEPLLDPIIEYPHSADGQAVGTAVVGGFRYDESVVDDLDDGYVFGDWSVSFSEPQGRLLVAAPADDGGRWSIEELTVSTSTDGMLNRYLLSFGRDREGELYVLTTGTNAIEGTTGAVHKIVPATDA